MSVESKLKTLLGANVTVAGLVSDRIYPMVLPQNPTLPAITYTRIVGLPVYSIYGYSGLNNAHVQVDCWASTYSGAKALAAAVTAAISSATTFKGVMVGDRDMFEDDVLLYRVSMDWSLWVKES